MSQEHQDNLALLREGRGITDGGVYITSVKDYCEHHGIEIPEQDREPEPEIDEEAGSATSPSGAALSGFERFVQLDDAGNVRAVLLGEWRAGVDADQDERQILAISPEDWATEFQPRLDEVDTLTERAETAEAALKTVTDEAIEKWLPQDLKARLVAIRGVGPALADTILAGLTTTAES